MNFIISVPSNVTLSSKSPYLTAHTKINYETGCIGRFLKKHRDVSWTTATARMELFQALVRSFHILTNLIFFSIRVFFTDTDDSQDSRGREGTIFYSTLPLPPVHEH